MQKQSANIAIIHDLREHEQAHSLADEVGMIPIALQSVTDAALRGMKALVYNIDLADRESVARVRSGLAALGPHAPMIFAVDGKAGFHRSRTQANALGATIVLRRPLKADELRDALRRLGVFVPETATASIDAKPGGASIKAAAGVLDTTFSALRDGRGFDVRQSVEASRALLAGVGTSGLNAWLETVRQYHEGTFQHCLLVTGAAVAYARQAKMSEKDQLALSVAALLHDVGKAEIPVEILDKPGKLTDAEFEIVKRHPVIARDYLNRQGALPPAVISAIAHHHEYLDGSGYPDGLSGDEIDQMTRVLTVCDIYGALAERRAYKDPKAPQESILILVDMANRGKVDYEVVRVLGAAVGMQLPEGHFRIL